MSEKVLDDLREAARSAAREGYYAEYLQAVVAVAVRGLIPANPDAERKEG